MRTRLSFSFWCGLVILSWTGSGMAREWTCPDDDDQDTQRAAGIVAFLHFNEGSGATTFGDSSGNQNNAACGASCPTAGAAGVINTGLLVSGAVGNYATIASAASLNVTNISISVWVALTSETGDGGVTTKGTGGGGEVWSLDTNGVNNFRFYFWKGGTAYVAASSAGYGNGWRHLVATYDGVNSIIYLDGIVAITSNINQGNLATNASPVSIGARQSGTTTFDYANAGLYDEYMLYSRAITRSEVRNLYRCGREAIAKNHPDPQPSLFGGLWDQNWAKSKLFLAQLLLPNDHLFTKRF